MTVRIDTETTIPDLPSAFREIGDELNELLAAEAELLITDPDTSTRWPHPGFPGATHATGLSIESFEGVTQGDHATLQTTSLGNALDYAGSLESGEYLSGKYQGAAETTLEQGMAEFIKTLEVAILRLLPREFSRGRRTV